MGSFSRNGSVPFEAKRYEYLGVTIKDNGLFIDQITLVRRKASKEGNGLFIDQ